MNDFFSMDNSLDAQKIYEKGYASQLFPEHISGDEINSVMAFFSQTRADVWTFEFGQAPELVKDKSIEEVSNIIFKDSYKNIFIQLDDIELFFWLPEGQDYFVIFGDKSAVYNVNKSKIFDYSFDEYIKEESFSKTKIEILTMAKKKFEIE